MTDQGFFKTARDWSRRKHFILRFYLEPAAAKLRRVSPDGRVFVLDGYAGRGQYEDGTPGSPVCMGQLADKCQTFTPPLKLRILNAEPDTATYNELNEATKLWVDRGVMSNLNRTFQEALPLFLGEASHCPLFAFLDPFCPTDLGLEDAVPLLRRGGATELLCVLHTPSIKRLIAAARPGARTTDKTKAGHAATLDRIFGGGPWRKLLRLDPLQPEEIAACFREALRERCPAGANHVYSHAINERYQAGLKYHVVFWTRHPDGVRLMNDAFRRESEVCHTESGGQMRLNFPGEDPVFPEAMADAARACEVAKVLLAIGSASPGKEWKRTDLVFRAIQRRFGEFSQKEHLAGANLLLQRDRPPRLLALDGHRFSTGRWRTNDNTRLRFQLQ